MTLTDDYDQFAGYTSQLQLKCNCGSSHPELAGICPAVIQPQVVRLEQPTFGPIQAAVQAFMDQCVTFRGTEKTKRTQHAYGYDTRKLGVVNHIPVCDTLEQLDRYFISDEAQGSTHFGIGRTLLSVRVVYQSPTKTILAPFAPVSQYLPTVGPVSPWAQGIIRSNPNCQIAPHPIASLLGSGVPNGAYISIENVARTGAQGMTDAQFNSNVFLRAWASSYFQHPITPDTQIWHAEIDQLTRCNDPGWQGTGLEQEAQDAANSVLLGNYSRLRSVVVNEETPELNWAILAAISHKVTSGESEQLALAYTDLGAILGHNTAR